MSRKHEKIIRREEARPYDWHLREKTDNKRRPQTIQILDLAGEDFNIALTSMLNKIKEKTDNTDEMLESFTTELKSEK